MAKGTEGGWASVYAVSIWKMMEPMGKMLIGWYGKVWMYYTGSSSESLKLFPNKKWGKKTRWDFPLLYVRSWLIHSNSSEFEDLVYGQYLGNIPCVLEKNV